MMVHIWLQRQTWKLDTWEETDCSVCKKHKGRFTKSFFSCPSTSSSIVYIVYTHRTKQNQPKLTKPNQALQCLGPTHPPQRLRKPQVKIENSTFWHCSGKFRNKSLTNWEPSLGMSFIFHHLYKRNRVKSGSLTYKSKPNYCRCLAMPRWGARPWNKMLKSLKSISFLLRLINVYWKPVSHVSLVWISSTSPECSSTHLRVNVN